MIIIIKSPFASLFSTTTRRESRSKLRLRQRWLRLQAPARSRYRSAPVQVHTRTSVADRSGSSSFPCAHVIRRRWEFLGDSGPQVDRAFIAESRNELTRFGIERDKTSIAGPCKNPRRSWPITCQ